MLLKKIKYKNIYNNRYGKFVTLTKDITYSISFLMRDKSNGSYRNRNNTVLYQGRYLSIDAINNIYRLYYLNDIIRFLY